MAFRTLQSKLNATNVSSLASDLQMLPLGDTLAALAGGPHTIPTLNARTSLVSGAAQVHDKAAIILAVATDDTLRTIVPAGITPTATNVAIAYNTTTGVPTLTFSGAVTAYTVTEIPLTVATGTDLTAALAQEA